MRTLFRRRHATAHLRARQTLSFARGRGVTLRCLEGVCWVTREGDERDHVLRPGDSFRSDSPGRIVVWAVTDARLRIEPPGGEPLLAVPETAFLPSSLPEA
ncbi:MAG: DUF2917 domain-containing protein [Deltaproteobacteria bacterium]|nr:DUF2917 domain-containing protein [Deltaproteobacteria bacterium]